MGAQRIIIVGGGIAGLRLATRLGRSLGRGGTARILLIDRSFTHVWKPMLHTIAAGTRDVHQQQVHYLAHARENGYGYEPGELCGIDRDARQVMLGPIRSASGEVVVEPRSLRYDVLVLALGSGADDFGIRGVREHCHFIDSQAQAESFNEALRMRLLRAAMEDDDVRIGIVGAGATGVELAAELSHLLEVASGFGDAVMRQRLKLTLFESGPRILPAFPERVSAASWRVLERLGFSVETEAEVEGADADGLTVHGRGHVPTHLTVWAAGVKGPAAFGTLAGLETNRNRQLVIRANLQAAEDGRIFAIGDCASMTPPGAERPLPPTAQVAAQQAGHLARHLPDLLSGGRVPDHRHRELGSLVSLSRYTAYGTLDTPGPLPPRFFRGRLAQLGHAWLYRRHQAALHGWGRASLWWLAEGVQRAVRPHIRLG